MLFRSLGVLAAIDVNQLLLGEQDKLVGLNKDNNHAAQLEVGSCHTQAPWQWDGVHFRFIAWPIDSNAKANNHSCVLLVEFNGQKILLAGDIEKDVERILSEREEISSVDILLAPHHGSKTSSTAGFLARVRPHRVIYSAGFHNQHGHPHLAVQARYTEMGAVPHNTAYAGALEFIWRGQQSYRLTQYRQSQARYWYEKDHVSPVRDSFNDSPR